MGGWWGWLPAALVACHQQEQAVVGSGEPRSDGGAAGAGCRDGAGDEKGRAAGGVAEDFAADEEHVLDIHEPAAWANPFLAIGPETITLRIINADANTSDLGKGTMLRPEGARRQEIQIKPSELAEAMVAVSGERVEVWARGGGGRDAGGAGKDRAKMRRNVESAIQQLNDLGIVVEEWPVRR